MIREYSSLSIIKVKIANTKKKYLKGAKEKWEKEELH